MKSATQQVLDESLCVITDKSREVLILAKTQRRLADEQHETAAVSKRSASN